jgi:hypothetical protein
LVVITLLVLGCGAAFGQKTYSLGFLSYDQKTQYCDYEVLTVTPPNAGGVHNIQDACEFYNGPMVGVQAKIAPKSGAPVTGTVYIMADNSIDAMAAGAGDCGCVLLYVTKTVPATPQQLQAGGPFGWAFYFTLGDGSDYLGNYGFLTKELGGPPNNYSFDAYYHEAKKR